MNGEFGRFWKGQVSYERRFADLPALGFRSLGPTSFVFTCKYRSIRTRSTNNYLLVVYKHVVPSASQQPPDVSLGLVLVDREVDRPTQPTAHETRVPLVGVDPIYVDRDAVASKAFNQRGQTVSREHVSVKLMFTNILAMSAVSSLPIFVWHSISERK